jgi:hypothetical protein
MKYLQVMSRTARSYAPTWQADHKLSRFISTECSRSPYEGLPPGRVLDYETDLEHIDDAYAAMDERRAIKTLVRVGTG